MKIFLTLGFCVFFALNLTSQNNSDYNLLWKIESELQSQPSYLFGTMHVQDKRAFNFSDSVMVSIEKCAQFAMEVHPDSMIIAAINEVLSPDTTNYYKESMTEKEYIDFKERFEKENDFDFEELENKSPLIVKQYKEKQSTAFSNDKQTFVDMYLYGIAETLGKSTHGLEDVKNQMESLKFRTLLSSKFNIQHDSSKVIKMENELTDNYNDGSLSQLEELLGQSTFNSSLMKRRNIEMTKSIEELIENNTTFSAVGAAHLIGKNSIIKMLEERGYKLTPVPATFTGIADTYKIDNKKNNWTTVEDKEGAFQVSFPDEHMDFSRNFIYPGTPDSIFLTNLFYSDLVNLKNYVFSYNDFPLGYYLDNPEDIYTLFIEEINPSGMLSKDVKDIEVNGVKGKEYRFFLNKEYDCIVRFFVRGNRTYKMLLQNLNKGDTTEMDLKFFNSLQFTPYKENKLIQKSNSQFDSYYSFGLDNEEFDTINNPTDFTMDSYVNNTLNTNSGGCYVTVKSKIDDFFKIESRDSFYNLTISNLQGWQDTIVSSNDYIINDSLARECIIHKRRHNSYIRYKTWIDGDQFLSQMLFADSTEIFGVTADDFFSKHPQPKVKKSIDLYKSKTHKIISGLQSNDSITKQLAKGALSYYAFKKSDLPILHKTLNTFYNKDTLVNQNALLLLKEIQILKDTNSISILRSLYLDHPAPDDLKSGLLNTINNIGSVDDYMDLLFNDTQLETEESYSLIYPFYDSLDLVYKNYSSLLELLNNANFREHILSVSANLLASTNSDYHKIVSDNYTQLFKNWNEDMDSLKNRIARNSDNYFYDSKTSTYLEVFNSSVDSRNIKFINELANIDTSGHYDFDLNLSKITHSMAYDETEVDSMFNNIYYNYEAIKAFYLSDNVKQLPDSLQTSKGIALSKLKSILYYEDISTDSLTYYKTTNLDGSKCYVYKITDKYYSENFNSYYYGMVGPIQDYNKLNPKDLKAYYFYIEEGDNIEDSWEEFYQSFKDWGY